MDSFRILEGFLKDSQGIPEGFSRDSFRILKGFLKDSQGIRSAGAGGSAASDVAMRCRLPGMLIPRERSSSNKKKKIEEICYSKGFLKDSQRIP